MMRRPHPFGRQGHIIAVHITKIAVRIRGSASCHILENDILHRLYVAHFPSAVEAGSIGMVNIFPVGEYPAQKPENTVEQENQHIKHVTDFRAPIIRETVDQQFRIQGARYLQEQWNGMLFAENVHEITSRLERYIIVAIRRKMQPFSNIRRLVPDFQNIKIVVRLCLMILDTQIAGQFPFAGLYESLPVLVKDFDIDIIIPGNETAVPDCTQQSAGRQPILDIVSPADSVDELQDLQRSQLQFTQRGAFRVVQIG